MIRCWFGLAWQPVNCHEDSLPPPSPPPPPPSPPPPPPPSPPHSRHPRAKLCVTLQVEKKLIQVILIFISLQFAKQEGQPGRAFCRQLCLTTNLGKVTLPNLISTFVFVFVFLFDFYLSLLNNKSGEGNFT